LLANYLPVPIAVLVVVAACFYFFEGRTRYMFSAGPILMGVAYFVGSRWLLLPAMVYTGFVLVCIVVTLDVSLRSDDREF
jgi:hypothetical protein